MAFRIFHSFILPVILGFLAISQALAQVGDSVSRAVANQVQSAVTGSIYGQLVPLSLAIPETQRKFVSGRFQAFGKILMQHFADGTVLVWDFERGTQVNEFRLADSAVPVRYDAAIGDLYVLNNATLQRVKRTKADLAYEKLAPENSVSAFVLSADGKSMYLGTPSGEAVKLTASGALVWKKKVLDVGIRQLAASQDGARLTVLGDNNRASTLNADGSPAFSQADIAYLGGYDQKGSQAFVGTQGAKLSVSSGGKPIPDATRVNGGLQALSISQKGSHWLALTSEGKLGQVTDKGWTPIDEGVKFAVFLGDKRYLYVKHDGVAFLRSVDTAHYLLTIVPGQHGWVVVDHEGRYDGSVAGTKDVTWKADKEALSLDQFFEAYYQPGLLSSYVNEQSGQVGTVPAYLVKGAFLPPKLEMDFPGGKMEAGKEAKVVAVAESRGGDLAEDIRFFHNGKRLPPKARLGSQKVERDGRLLLVEVFAFVPEPGANEVFSETRNSHGITGRSAVRKEITDGFRSEGSLHVVGIGVDKYRMSEFNLDFAKADATSVAGQIGKASKGFYSNVVQSTLSDSAATRKSVLAALEGLNRARPQDSLILVLAGHGTVSEGEWYFLPHDMNPKKLKETAVSARELQDALVNSPAKKIMLMVDACHSGAGIDNFNRYREFLRRFVQQVGRSAGITVLTAARRDQLAAEAPHLGHGLFTYIVLEGLGGLADTNPRDSTITAHELASYVGDNLEKRGAILLEPPSTRASDGPRNLAVSASGAEPKASAHEQSPAYFVIGSDFPIAAFGK
jgi:hypothetical protein